MVPSTRSSFLDPKFFLALLVKVGLPVKREYLGKWLPKETLKGSTRPVERKTNLVFHSLVLESLNFHARAGRERHKPLTLGTEEIVKEVKGGSC